MEGTAQFVKQFCAEQKIGLQERSERAKGRGRDWHVTIGPGEHRLRASFFQAAVDELPEAMAGMPGGARCHAVVCDLPYGIQHKGQVCDLLADTIHATRPLLPIGSRIVAAWDSTRLDRDELLDGIGPLDRLEVCAGGPFDELSHRVDRVIKRRDVIAFETI